MHTDNIYHDKKWIILFLVLGMTFMACLDSSIVNVALPTMAKKLHVDMGHIELVLTSYLAVISSLIIIFGRISDIKGKTVIFKMGIAVFTLASLACGLAPNLEILLIARVGQALGAACAMSTNQAIITQVFPASERGRALGMAGMSIALGLLLGPPLGGIITDYFSWNYIFFINVPIGLITFLLCLKYLPFIPPEKKEKFDILGGILFFISTIFLFTFLSFVSSMNFSYKFIALITAVCVSLFAIFIWVEQKTKEPLLQLGLFKNKIFSISIFRGFCSFLAVNCLVVILPFYFQDVMNLTAKATGFLMMCSPLVLSVFAPLSGYLADKIEEEILVLTGLMVSVIGYLLLSTLHDKSNITHAVIFLCVVSLGSAIFQPPNTSIIMSTAPKSKLSVVGSINALVRNLGQISGVLISTGILYALMSHVLGYRVTDYVAGRNDVFIYAMHYVFIFSAIICSIGIFLTIGKIIIGKKYSKF